MEDSPFTADGFTIGVSLCSMKGDRIRYQQTGEFHFLTFSCYRRRPYLSTVAAMELFEDALERVRLRYFFVVAGYVVMPEHVHLLVNEPRRGLLSRSAQALKLSVSMRSRERPFWQAHYYDFNVSAQAKFVEKLRYIHRNLVGRGLVAKPEDWKWSSFRHYQTGMRGIVEIESEWTASERGWQLPEWMRCRQFGSSSPATLNRIESLLRSGPPAEGITVEDGPSVPLDTSPDEKEATDSTQFQIYLMWDSESNSSVPVPLGSLLWETTGDAIYNSATKEWTLKPGTSATTSSSFAPSATYPEWSRILTGTIKFDKDCK